LSGLGALIAEPARRELSQAVGIGDKAKLVDECRIASIKELHRMRPESAIVGLLWHGRYPVHGVKGTRTKILRPPAWSKRVGTRWLHSEGGKEVICNKSQLLW